MRSLNKVKDYENFITPIGLIAQDPRTFNVSVFSAITSLKRTNGGIIFRFKKKNIPDFSFNVISPLCNWASRTLDILNDSEMSLYFYQESSQWSKEGDFYPTERDDNKIICPTFRSSFTDKCLAVFGFTPEARIEYKFMHRNDWMAAGE
jgi:hypothetical protein